MFILPAGIGILAAITATQPSTAGADIDPAATAGVLFAILFFSALSLVLAIRFGVFRRADIVGPDRLPKQGAGMLLGVFFFTLVVWMCAQSAYLTYRQSQWRKEGINDISTHTEALLNTQDWATLSTLPPMLGFAFMLGAGAFLNRGWLDRLGINSRNFWPGIRSGIIGFLIAGPPVFWTLILLNALYQFIQYDHPKEHVLLKSLGEAEHRGAGLLIALGATICAPLFEEFLFRGHLQTLIRQMLMRLHSKRPPIEVEPAPVLLTFGSSEISPLPATSIAPVLAQKPLLQPAPWHGWIAIFITSMIFAGFHPLWMWPPIFVLSLGLGYIYERTGNLWATITIHCLFNSLETLQYLLLMRGH